MPDIEVLKNCVIDWLDKRLPEDLHYHDKQHTIDVYTSAKQYAQLEKIPSHETMLLLTAALFHDIGYIRQYEDNEPIGAKIASVTLSQYNGYSQQDIEAITRIILATQMPQNPQTHLQRILCDADLDHLGRDDFLEKGDLLRKEWEISRGIRYEGDEWYKIQLEFLKNHIFFTESARKLRDTGKLSNIERLEKLIGMYPSRSR
ncbi:MAG: HD domain-containing protein [Candidatus Bipolaricaulia bacterium]